MATEFEVEERKLRKKQHDEDLALLTEESDFLDLTPVWNTRANTYIIVGERCGGKTFGTLKHCIEDYKKTGRRFAYIRRIEETIAPKILSDLLEPFVTNEFVDKPLIKKLWGDDYEIRYKLHRFEVYNKNDPKEEPEIIGYTAALSTAAKVKSAYTEEDKIYNFIVDEFLPMVSEKCPANEYDLYEQLLSSMCRAHIDQSVVYLIGNTVTKWSEYLYRLGVTYEMLDVKNQGKIQQIVLPADEEHVEEKVTFLLCRPNAKLMKKNSLHIRKSKMAIGQGWEMKLTAEEPIAPGEKSSEKLLCTLFDPVMGRSVGFFVKNSENIVIEDAYGIKKEVVHYRQYLVVRQTSRVSDYYHLTNVKTLKRNCWNDIDTMFADIKERTGIDIYDEIIHTRVFVDNYETGDILFKLYEAYSRMPFRDTF